MKKLLVLLIAVIPAATLFGLGGGGTFYGTNSAFADEINNSGFEPMSLRMIGGYGYGVDWDGTKIGGFGMSFVDQNRDEIAGGFGGMILGSYSRLGPFSFSGNALVGVGGLSWPAYFHGEGGVAAMAQIDIELGLPVLPWFQVSGYGGVQFIMPITAGTDPILRYPVMGLRFTWGDF
jgi:hypothetical protein